MKRMDLIAALLIIIFLAGCSGNSGQNQNNKKITDFYKGKEGLVMQFLPNLPANKIYSSGGVHIGVKFENKGTFNIENGIVTIVGYDTILVQNLAPVSPSTNSLDLYGKSLDFAQGEYQIKEFKSSAIVFPDNTNFLSAPFKVMACYPYETDAFIPICMFTMNYDKAAGKEVCQIRGYSSTAGQGAPVGVTKIEQIMIPEDNDNTQLRAQFTIHVQNIGKGEVIDSYSYESPCSVMDEVEKDDLNNVRAQVFIGERDITSRCEPIDQLEGGQMKIKLLNKGNFFVCSDSIPRDKSTYQTMLKVVLTYGYYQSIEKKVEIVKS